MQGLGDGADEGDGGLSRLFPWRSMPLLPSCHRTALWSFQLGRGMVDLSNVTILIWIYRRIREQLGRPRRTSQKVGLVLAG